MSEYLAVIPLPLIGGAYGRSNIRGEAVEIARRSAIEAADQFGGFRGGMKVRVKVYDVTGYEDLFWDGSGLAEQGGRLVRLVPEVIEILPTVSFLN